MVETLPSSADHLSASPSDSSSELIAPELTPEEPEDLAAAAAASGEAADLVGDGDGAPLRSIDAVKTPLLSQEARRLSEGSSLSDRSSNALGDSPGGGGGAGGGGGGGDGGPKAQASPEDDDGGGGVGGVRQYIRPLQPPHQPQQQAQPSQSQQRILLGLGRANMPRNASADESRASSTAGLWGWFEDHDRSTPPHSSTDLRRSQSERRESERGGGKGGGRRGSGGRRGGGFHLMEIFAVGRDVLSVVAHDDDGRPNAASAMAVTAPTYVLEESLSSQQLWKETAGNRPPQPAEERAFFEKIWAQNFLRSQASYEMPVEVLTATSPISLSPFADGNFGGDAGTGAAAGEGAAGSGGGGGAEISNYNVLASGDGTATASPASRLGRVRVATDSDGGGPYPGAPPVAAEAAAAEASLLQRLGVAGAAQHYTHARSAFGPHRYHHTPVNQRVVLGRGGGGGGGNGGGGAGGGGGGGSAEADDVLTVVVRGDNVFGTTVSKSFERRTSDGAPDPLRTGATTVSVSIASYRVVESRRRGKYAQFLVIYCEGTFRDTVGVWKRYSDFHRLSRKVMLGNEGCTSALAGMHPLHIAQDHEDDEDGEAELLPNAVTSWKLLKKRQRWFRCLDAEYLSLKVFLLERFLHDILFESSSPEILRDFVGVNPKGKRGKQQQ